MTTVYLLLGSNEGKREENLGKALALLAERCGKVLKSSGIYETEAWGIKEQNGFLNQAIQISVNHPPLVLLNLLKVIEKEAGRKESIKWGPRVIDIDILFYGGEIIDLPELKVPHPFIQGRRFTLVPMNEMAPFLMHPVLKKSMTELLAECTDLSRVVPY